MENAIGVSIVVVLLPSVVFLIAKVVDSFLKSHSRGVTESDQTLDQIEIFRKTRNNKKQRILTGLNLTGAVQIATGTMVQILGLVEALPTAGVQV